MRAKLLGRTKEGGKHRIFTVKCFINIKMYYVTGELDNVVHEANGQRIILFPELLVLNICDFI